MRLDEITKAVSTGGKAPGSPRLSSQEYEKEQVEERLGRNLQEIRKKKKNPKV